MGFTLTLTLTLTLTMACGWKAAAKRSMPGMQMSAAKVPGQGIGLASPYD